MTDRYDPNLILDYVEGELDSRQRERFEALLAEDDTLRALVEQLGGDRAAVRALPAERPPTDLTEAATGSMERELLLGESPIPIAAGKAYTGADGGARARGWPWVRLSSYAAVAAMLAVVGVIVLQAMRGTDLPERADSLYPGGFAEAASAPDAEEMADDGSGAMALLEEEKAVGWSEDAGVSARREPVATKEVVVADAVAESFVEVLEAGEDVATFRGSEVAVALEEHDVAMALGRGVTQDAEAADLSALVLGSRVSPSTDEAGLQTEVPDVFALGDTHTEFRLRRVNSEPVANADVQLAVFSRTPDMTRQQIVGWARANGALVIDGGGAGLAWQGVTRSAEHKAEQFSKGREDQPDTLRVVLNRGQVDELAAALNTQPRSQRASVQPVEVLAVTPGSNDRNGRAGGLLAPALSQSQPTRQSGGKLFGDTADGRFDSAVPAVRAERHRSASEEGLAESLASVTPETEGDAAGAGDSAKRDLRFFTYGVESQVADAPGPATQVMANTPAQVGYPKEPPHGSLSIDVLAETPYFQVRRFPQAMHPWSVSNVTPPDGYQALWVSPLIDDRRVELCIFIEPAVGELPAHEASGEAHE